MLCSFILTPMTLSCISLLTSNSSSALGHLLACVDEVKSWMAANFLKLNKSKTEVIIIGSSENNYMAGFNLGTLSPFRKHQIKKIWL